MDFHKVIASVALSVLAATLAFAQATLAFAQGTATVKGKVVFQGTPLKTRPVTMKQDKKCDAIHKGKPVVSEEFVLNKNGTLKWVLVYVKSGAKKGAAPKTPVVLDQEGCAYRPHVFGVMVGQKLEIINTDGFLHNVHFISKNNKEFNQAQPTKAFKIVKVFTSPELPPSCYFKCDVHPWMKSYVGVFDHPFFAVTGDDGTFAIKGLPAGTYEVEAWHEKLGTQKQTVTVKAGETKEITFTFKR